ncbi:hypothetical protein R9X47_09550 [Wukongibacter baidiensis]|uniref:hypothetical protein n=1 Tax=Wukongibacter baidiensis TaxID=1723361 RepID=UPI003D7F1C76
MIIENIKFFSHTSIDWVVFKILKKIGLAIIIVIMIFIIAFNINKYMIYNEFKGHLKGKYPEKSFKVHWVKYDILYDKYYAKVYCKNDGTEFGILKYKYNNSISEKYLEIKNRKEMNNIINSYFEKEEVFKYIRDISADAEKSEALDTDKNVDYNKIIETVYVEYYDNSIKNNIEFAEISYRVIQILKNNNVDFHSIDFVLEMDSKVYVLRLQEEEIDKESEDIFRLIERLK